MSSDCRLDGGSLTLAMGSTDGRILHDGSRSSNHRKFCGRCSLRFHIYLVPSSYNEWIFAVLKTHEPVFPGCYLSTVHQLVSK